MLGAKNKFKVKHDNTRYADKIQIQLSINNHTLTYSLVLKHKMAIETSLKIPFLNIKH